MAIERSKTFLKCDFCSRREEVRDAESNPPGWVRIVVNDFSGTLRTRDCCPACWGERARPLYKELRCPAPKKEAIAL